MWAVWSKIQGCQEGRLLGFYSSLRLRCIVCQKFTEEKTIRGEQDKEVVGVETEIESVQVSSVWKPFNRATVTII